MKRILSSLTLAALVAGTVMPAQANFSLSRAFKLIGKIAKNSPWTANATYLGLPLVGVGAGLAGAWWSYKNANKVKDEQAINAWIVIENDQLNAVCNALMREQIGEARNYVQQLRSDAGREKVLKCIGVYENLSKEQLSEKQILREEIVKLKHKLLPERGGMASLGITAGVVSSVWLTLLTLAFGSDEC